MLDLNDLFRQVSSPESEDAGRLRYPTLSVVTDVDDPEELARVRVANPLNPQESTGWILQVAGYWETPLTPEVGDTVLVIWAEGDYRQGVYLPVRNKRNPPNEDCDPTQDYALEVPRKAVVTVQDELTVRVDGETSVRLRSLDARTLETHRQRATEYELVSPQITLRTPTSSSFLTISNSGITLYSNQPIVWNLGGQTLTLQNLGTVLATNVSSARINGKEIAVVGALDSGGDVLVNRGY